jgi:hypothetical protein
VQITTGQIVNLAINGGFSPLPVKSGGTGDTTLTQYGLMYGNGTAPVGVLSPPAGTNYVLVGSSGSAPTWQPTIPVTAGVNSIAFGTTGLTPSAATAGVITVAGTLVAANGGTGQSSYTIGDLLYASSSTALSKLADVATGSVLISGGVGVAPSYSSSPTISGTTTSSFFIANGTITGSLSQGAYAYGTLPYSDTNIFASYQTNVNSYAQVILANTSNGSSASTDFIVGNDQTTTSSYFGDFGMNSSGFTGTGSLNGANNVFLSSTSADLVIGTTTSNAIRFVVNNGATDAMTIAADGTVTIPSAAIDTTSITTPLLIGGSTASSSLTLQSTSGAGTTDSILFKVGNAGATTAMTIASDGTVTIPNASITATSITTPLLIGGTTASSILTIESTSGAGTSDSIVFKTGSQLTRMTISTAGLVTANNFASSSAAITGGSINSTTVGATTRSTGAFTTLQANAAVTFATTTNAQSYTTTGAGTITITSGTAGNINNMNIGGTTRGTGAFTTLGANGAVTIQTTTNNQSYTTTGAGTITISSGTAGTINNMTIGGTTAAAGTFTTVTAPTVQGGTAISSTLTLQSTSGAGTTDAILFNTGSQSERMRIDTSGNVSIGSSGTTTGVNLLTNAQITGATSAYVHYNNGSVQSGVTNQAVSYYSNISSVAAAFTTTTVNHFYAAPATGGAGSIITNQIGFNAESTVGTQGAATITNAYGFYGALASGTNRWNLYMTGTANNYMAGNLGIGSTSLTAVNLAIGSNITGATTSYAQLNNGVVQSTATNAGLAYASSISVAAGVTTTEVDHFWAFPNAGGAGSTITNQYGFNATSALGTTGAATITNAYGFYGALASGTNRYNFYASGTANNLFSGYSFGKGGVMATTNATATNTATLTATQIASGFIIGTPTATASYTLPLASALDTELVNAATGYNFEIVVFTTAAFAITLLTNTGWTLVGSMATGATANSFARFRAVKTGTATYSLYRIS